jgi:hypothetical protein
MALEPKPTAAGKTMRERGRKWLNRIEEAARVEKHWLDDAEVAVTAYTGEKGRGETTQAGQGIAYDFNMAYANVETIVPAILNSPPAPDIRRRFGDDDPVAKAVAEIIERSIRVQVDDSKLQVEMEAMAQDAFLAGRGVIRLRFKSEISGGETTDEELSEHLDDKEAGQAVAKADDDAPEEDDAAVEEVTGERICFEAVSWRDFRHGPAKRWDQVPWMAFRHSMSHEDCDDFADIALASSQYEDGDQIDGDADKDHVVWEVWDKRHKLVLFIRHGDGVVLKTVQDPLGLSTFFPIATPVQAIEVTGRLMPVNPFSIYKKLADELDRTTKRISTLTKQLKLKGWYAISAADLQSALDADDNEFVPVADAEIWAQNGGLQNAVLFWPVERIAAVLMQLYQVRDQTKQAIYEITGISDIVRGASMANETATAQSIKSQWGSLRIQKMQRMMARAARDLFVMMSEIIPTKFAPETLQQMTQVQILPTPEEQQPVKPQMPQVPPGAPQEAQQQAAQEAQQQAQAAEQARQQKLGFLMQVQALMRQKVTSFYRIDVETDSTIQADLTRQKEEATGFMQAASAYFGSVAPLVQQGALPMDVAVEIFSSFSRMFNLGKSVEDALDELLTKAKEKANQPPQPSAEEQQAQAEEQRKQKDFELRQQEVQGKLQASQMEQQIKLQQAQAKIQADAEERAARIYIERLQAEAEATKGRQEAASKELDLQIKAVQLQIEQAKLAGMTFGRPPVVI